MIKGRDPVNILIIFKSAFNQTQNIIEIECPGRLFGKDLRKIELKDDNPTEI